MGSSRRVTIEPFIKVRNKIITKDVEFLGCVNTSCSSYHVKNDKTPFCSHCGEKISIFTEKVKTDKINVWEFTEDELNGDLYPVSKEYLKVDKDIEYLTSNKTSPFDLNKFLDNDSDDVVMDIDMGEQQRKHLEWFKENYKDHIQKLKDTFGEENISIHYGIIASTN